MPRSLRKNNCWASSPQYVGPWAERAQCGPYTQKKTWPAFCSLRSRFSVLKHSCWATISFISFIFNRPSIGVQAQSFFFFFPESGSSLWLPLRGRFARSGLKEKKKEKEERSRFSFLAQTNHRLPLYVVRMRAVWAIRERKCSAALSFTFHSLATSPIPHPLLWLLGWPVRERERNKYLIREGEPWGRRRRGRRPELRSPFTAHHLPSGAQRLIFLLFFFHSGPYIYL